MAGQAPSRFAHVVSRIFVFYGMADLNLPSLFPPTNAEIYVADTTMTVNNGETPRPVVDSYLHVHADTDTKSNTTEVLVRQPENRVRPQLSLADVHLFLFKAEGR